MMRTVYTKIQSVLLLFLVLNDHILAQDLRKTVKCQVQAGFSGIIERFGGLFPVFISLENTGQPVKGVIELTQPTQGGEWEVCRRLHFNLPAPSKKRFVMRTRFEPQRHLYVKVAFEKSPFTIRREVPLKHSDKPLLLALGVPMIYHASKLSSFYRMVRIMPEDLDLDALSLHSITVIMINGAQLLKLDRRILLQLRDWCRTGGSLVLVNPLEDDVYHAKLRVLFEDLAIDPRQRQVFHWGAGCVTFSGMDEQERVFWEEDEALLTRAFPAVLGSLIEDSDFAGEGHFTDMWEKKRTFGGASFTMFIVFVVLYIVMIGPVDKWIVTRLGKPWFTWIFFLACIVVFSILAFGYSKMVNIGNMRLVGVHVLDHDPGAGLARGRSMIWLYSSQNRKYEIASERKMHALDFSARETRYGAGYMLAGVELLDGKQPLVKARIPIFSAKQMDAAWFAEWPAGKVEIVGDEAGRLALPKKWKADQAYLVDADGVHVLKKEGADNMWRLSRNYTWVQYARFQRSRQAVPWHRYQQSGLIMPRKDDMRDYLIWLSFPALLTGNEQEDDEIRRQIDSRDSVEISLDIRHRLQAGGAVLLLVLEAEHPLPLAIKGGWPEKAELSLVRIVLPPSS